MYNHFTGLGINFKETDYAIEEGGTLSSDIRLRFSNNQNPFTITLNAVSINTTEDLIPDLGLFINFDDIQVISRATAGILSTYVSLSTSFHMYKNGVLIAKKFCPKLIHQRV